MKILTKVELKKLDEDELDLVYEQVCIEIENEHEPTRIRRLEKYASIIEEVMGLWKC